ncbi:flagellar biosynthesis protein FliQ [Brevibacillus sp. 7WMA2]|uniref:Flagellar biosynthetic protein FliQ n=3 Tax=Brevibacillus TaxID=55080 RepID=A0A075R868_BRELA|nr:MULTISPECIES: flagellar biosynthesis protein FliQ [Brevibacillus]QOS99698.1 flagellar biosynthesis protein FliQ [Brevibacterium sp. JNUCC-42]HAS00708.1 flagellar biosynthetic protein FliQ [Brevibacillus sp.]AIG27601.1 flagellar biosynthetic protein FliQ [Brevibacillus laterosporus LMG 15441]AKF94568.1 flagellar biosynthesis protein FliQ [Brevibacillus laterosporus]ATO47942.1 EscS/YscS/HrcS family type III secretion system export apparatus protein [Brevibacillus laterosporus DSM 25]
MTSDMILQIAQSSVYTILIVLAPILGIALLVGLMVSIFQATTQIQEQTLAFIPKIVAVFLSLLIFGPWMLRIVIEFTANIMGNLYRFVG